MAYIESLKKTLVELESIVTTNLDAMQENASSIRQTAEALLFKADLEDMTSAKNRIGELEANQEVIDNVIKGKCDVDWIKKQLKELMKIVI